MTDGSRGEPTMTAGIDLGDRYSYLCLLDTESGEVIEEGRLRTTPEAFGRRFGSERFMRIAIEAGTHSPWVSRLLGECSHEVLVTNARKLKLIYAESRKTDRIDAEKLARLARLDPKLLATHRASGRVLPGAPCLDPLPRSPGPHQGKAHQPCAVCGQAVRSPPTQVLSAGLPQEGLGRDTGSSESSTGADTSNY